MGATLVPCFCLVLDGCFRLLLQSAARAFAALNGLEAHCRFQLRDIPEVARNTADNWEMDKPRAFWVEDYCAQLALVGTQIIWTEEVCAAFDSLEDGNEEGVPGAPPARTPRRSPATTRGVRFIIPAQLAGPIINGCAGG